MKKSEKIALLSSSIYALELIKSNDVYIKIKSAAKAVALYKHQDNESVQSLIALLNKIRTGSVITRYANLVARRNAVTLDETQSKKYDREITGIEKEMNSLYSMCETLNAQAIDLLKTMYSTRQGDKTVAETYKKLEITALNIIERTTKSPKGAEKKKGIETIFAKAESILKDAEKEAAEEVEEVVEPEAVEVTVTEETVTEETETAVPVSESDMITATADEIQDFTEEYRQAI